MSLVQEERALQVVVVQCQEQKNKKSDNRNTDAVAQEKSNGKEELVLV